MLSDRLKLALLRSRLNGVRQYRLALDAGLHPNALSGILHGAIAVRHGDARIIRLGASLGITASECFEKESEAVAS